MSARSTVDILFKEHSFEEIESVRDNLAIEIDKRTELLKSIVKEKYRDVVETSDAIQSMRSILTTLELSIQRLDSIILEFHENAQQSNSCTKRNVKAIYSEQEGLAPHSPEGQVRQILTMISEIWSNFDSGNLKKSVKLYNECKSLLKKCESNQDNTLLNSLQSNLGRAEQMIKNFLWYRIQSAETSQIGIIAGSDEEELYTISLESSIEFMIDKLRKDLFDISFQAQIRRYQEYQEVNDTFVQIPKAISVELSAFLFETCRVINTIAGFSLTRNSILASLRNTITQILDIYEELIPTVNTLNDGSKRRRAMQLYFDLMYIRVLLNTSKDLELIEELDPRVLDLMGRYERMLDTIELYMVSDALHTNVLRLSTSTIRLYGLLVPYLQ